MRVLYVVKRRKKIVCTKHELYEVKLCVSSVMIPNDKRSFGKV